MVFKRILVFIALFFHACYSHAQTSVLSQTLSISAQNQSLKDILTDITHQTGVHFTYSSNNVDIEQKITLNESNVPLKQLLNKLTDATQLQWTLIGHQIALTAKSPESKLCGFVLDSVTEQPIPFAIVSVKSDNYTETTDIKGKFCLPKKNESSTMVAIKAFGYQKKELVIESASKITVKLSPHPIELEETIISSDKIIENTSLSDIQISDAQMDAAKGLSNDPMKAITSAPGVLALVDFFGPIDIHIRGGEGNENLFLLDNIRLPFPFYFIGQSVINPDMIDKTELLTGGFNANYGNAMSSVFNFSTKTGHLEQYSGNVDLSFFNSSALVQGPVVKNKLSGIIGFRQSNISLLLRALGFRSNMNDVTSKFTYILNARNKLNFTSLYVTDKLDFSGKPNELANLKSTDKISAHHLQLQSVLSGKCYNKFSLLYSSLNLKASTDNASYHLNNQIYSTRNDFTYYPNTFDKLKLGIELNAIAEKALVKDVYRATDIRAIDSLYLYKERPSNAINYQGAAYFFYEGKIFSRLNYMIGGRFDYNYLNTNFDVSPRTTLSYHVSNSTVFSAAWGFFTQSPDIYSMLQNKQLRSNQCIHYIASVKQEIYRDLKLKTEVYYKDYKNQVVFDTAWVYSNGGYGTAKGFEIVAQKETGRLSGWLSYAYALSERKRNLQDKSYPSFYDQRHAYNALITFSLKEKKRKWFVPTHYSLQFKYATGNPYTPVVGIDSVAGKLQFLTGAINSARNTDYQNLNAKIQWQRTIGKKQNHVLKYYVDFWNLLSSRNIIERVYTLSTTGDYSIKNRFTTPFLLSLGIKFIFNKL